MMYEYVYVAGTFDGIHAGHEALLQKAFDIGDRVLIGLTSDEFVLFFKLPRLPKLPRIHEYLARKRALSSWLDIHNYCDRATIVPIDDPFEPAVSAKDVGALVVSQETEKRGVELNDKRKANGLSLLDLIVVPMQKAEDGKYISSTRVRKQEIDRLGKLLMPDSMRAELVTPLGIVLSGPEMVLQALLKQKRSVIVTVGDLTTKTVLDAGVTPKLMIVDNKVGRVAFADLQPIFRSRKFPVHRVSSGPGFISSEARRRIHESLSDKENNPHVIEVNGEEDLLALPVISEAPLGAVVYYGQPGVGVVEVVVTAAKKQEAQQLLERFISP